MWFLDKKDNLKKLRDYLIGLHRGVKVFCTRKDKTRETALVSAMRWSCRAEELKALWY